MEYTTTKVYNAMRQFTETRAEARDKYLATVERLRDYAGSKYYSEQMDKAKAERERVVEAARSECNSRLKYLFETMHELNRKRKLPAPTEEQLRLLQLLQMRDKVTRDELDAAANALEDNAAAMAALHELARKNEILHDYRQDATGYSIAAADAEIDRLARECRKVLESSAKSGARSAARLKWAHYGVEYNEDQLPQLPAFETESAFESFMCYGFRLRDATAKP